MNTFSIRHNREQGQYEFWNGRFLAAAPQSSLPHQLASQIAEKRPSLAKQAWRAAQLVANGHVTLDDRPAGYEQHLIATVVSSSGDGQYEILRHNISQRRTCGCRGFLYASAPTLGSGQFADTPICIHILATVIAQKAAAKQPTNGRFLPQAPAMTKSEAALIASGITPIRLLDEQQHAAADQRRTDWQTQWQAVLDRQEAAQQQPDPIGPALANVRRTDGRITVTRQMWEDAKIDVMLDREIEL